jgi:malate dehydrogenase (decarboxylating)
MIRGYFFWKLKHSETRTMGSLGKRLILDLRLPWLIHAFNRNTAAPAVGGSVVTTAVSLRHKSDVPTTVYHRNDVSDCVMSRSKGLDVLHDPVFNKGTGHSLVERERLGLRGLLPPRVLSMEEQIERNMLRYESGEHGPGLKADNPESSGVTDDMLRKWQVLQELQDRNETLFYRMLVDNFVQMAPIVYTPTVGHVCKNYHKLYRRPRGMFFSSADKGQMSTMMYNWPSDDVSAIVVTDGSRILGLGDLGANGLGIPVGKLDLYVAGGGFDPRNVLPCVIDVGTNNEELLQDPGYMGMRHPRLMGNEYYELIDEFVAAVANRWPHAVIQFEDFSSNHARILLERYRYSHCMFNDDIQGTAAAAAAGLIGALQVKGKPASALKEEKVVIVGTGSAGVGVATMVIRMMMRHGLTHQEATSRLYILDVDGLVTQKRSDLEDAIEFLAREEDGVVSSGDSLLDVVQKVKPTALLGLTGAGRLFTDEIISLMGEATENPIIMPMSNPTSRLECTHESVRRICGGRAIFSCGSPQPDVEMDGRVYRASQANNMYIFPGIALGAYLSKGNVVSDNMIVAAAESLRDMITAEEIQNGQVYPDLHDIRKVSCHVAGEVIKAAHEEGNVVNHALIRAIEKGDTELTRYIKSNMYWPEYKPLVSPRWEP